MSLFKDKLIDYIAMDIKNSIEKYPLTTGLYSVDVSRIEESIKFIINSGIDYEFRTTLINEFHTENDIISIGKSLVGAKRMFLQHFVDNGNCIKNGLHKIEKEKALEFKHLLEKSISNVNLRGYD